MLTDPNVMLRATADGEDPNTTPVSEVTTSDVVYCFEDEDVGAAARKMEEHRSEP